MDNTVHRTGYQISKTTVTVTVVARLASESKNSLESDQQQANIWSISLTKHNLTPFYARECVLFQILFQIWMKILWLPRPSLWYVIVFIKVFNEWNNIRICFNIPILSSYSIYWLINHLKVYFNKFMSSVLFNNSNSSLTLSSCNILPFSIKLYI